MESELLAGVLQTDTHRRLQVSEQLIDYFKKEENFDGFPEFESLISGLTTWMGSSNFKVSVSGMQVVEIIVSGMKEKFRPYVPTILPLLRERLGDAKDQVREQAQSLIQKLMLDCVSSPQVLLDKLLESCLTHKNWRIKEQGLLCLSRTLSYFGSGQVSVSKFMGAVCSLLGDANSQVRSGAVDTIVEIYRHVGVKVRIDISKRDLSSARKNQLTARFDAVDATTGNHTHLSDYDDDKESISSCGSSASARTHGSSRSTGSRPQTGLSRLVPTGSGAITAADFEKAFSANQRMNLYTQHDVEKTLTSINKTLVDTRNSWDLRVTALKDLRSLADQEVIDHAHFAMLLKSLETALSESLKDLRSQITREACVSLSYLCVVLGQEVSTLASSLLPELFSLLPNSAKVMATSAEICVKFVIKHSPSPKIFAFLSSVGFSSKSAVIRRYSSEFLEMAVSSFDTSMLSRINSQLEELIQLSIKDHDAVARKNGRRTFWAYHEKFPSHAQRLLESFDSHTQKHVNDERSAIESKPSAGLHPKLKTIAAPSSSENDVTVTDQQHSPSSPGHAPSLRLTRPTVRGRIPSSSSKALRSAASMDNMFEETERASPLQRPPSRTGGLARPSSRSGIRPSSRAGISRTNKKSSSSTGSVGHTKGQRISRSAQPSPAHSRETSPNRLFGGGRTTASRKIAPLTADSLSKLIGNSVSGRDDEDDAASVNSERSALSFSSEISINPYAKFAHPVEDLNELVAMCSSQQWSERRDGIAQLHMLLESSRLFSHSDMEKVKAVFKRMFQEPHAKVYGMFLDTLSRFIQEHREYLDDWLFILLLRLLQRSGTDMLSSVLFKLQMVLEHIRKAFDPDAQFGVLCRIVTDPTQTLNNKVKLAFLEYLLELLPMLDPSDFKDSQEIRQAVAKIVKFIGEPKSAEIRKQSQKAVIALFDLSPATLSMILRTLPKADQENANRILNTYMSELPSSGDESDREINSITPRSKKGIPAKSSANIQERSSAKSRMRTPSSNRINPAASLPPSGPRGLKGIRSISSSSPNMYGDPTRSLTPRSNLPVPTGGRTTPSLIPTPRRGLRRPMSTTPGSSPSTGTRKRTAPPRSASVGPEKLAQQINPTNSFKDSALKVPRPGSARSDYTPAVYQNGNDSNYSSSSSLEHFSLSDLPNLDFGSPDDDEGEDDFAEIDHMSLVVKELQNSSISKQRLNALQSLYTLSREFPERCKWEEHFKAVLLKLVEIISDPDSSVKVLVLRIIREMLKTEQSRLKDYAELTTMKVLKAFADNDSVVSQAAEDVFPLLAPALPGECAIELLAPLAASEKHPMLLGIIKLLTKVTDQVDVEHLKSKLSDIVPGVTRGYCHSESSVRKASVFCLVAIHSVVGDTLKDHLTRLSSSQAKLLDLYIKRHQQEAAKSSPAKR